MLGSKLSETPQVLVIGAMNLDILATAGQAALADDSTPGQVTFSAGGVGRNIAEGLVRLSTPVVLYSVVGDDSAGKQLLTLCESAGLNTDCVTSVPVAATPVYVSINNHDGNMLHAVSDMSLMEQCDCQMLNLSEAVIAQTSICVIDANLPQSVIDTISNYGTQTPLVAEAVSVSKCKRLAGVLASLALLKVNRQEAAVLTGQSADANPQVLGQALREMGPDTVLMSLGAQGVALFDECGMQKVEAPAVNVVSVNGAGDVLLAGYLAACLRDHEPLTCLQWAMAAARFSLESYSACSDKMTLQRLIES